MKYLIPILLLIFTSCVSQTCLDKAILLCQKNPTALIKYGLDAKGLYHCEAIWIKDNIEYPIDGQDTIIKIIPQNKYLKYWSWEEAQEKWRSHE
jgi:hypothetical protein